MLPTKMVFTDATGMQDRQIDYGRDGEIAQAIIRVYHNLSQHKQLSCPVGVWAKNFRKWEERYIPALENENVAEVGALLRNFFRNELSDGLISHKGKSPLWLIVLRDIYTLTRLYPDIVLQSLEIPPIGNPYGLVIDDFLITPDAPRHYAHARTIVEAVANIEHPIILEIGSGYGGVWHFVTMLMGEKKFTYIMVDIEPVLFVAYYFAMNTLDVHGQGREFLLGDGEKSNIGLGADEVKRFSTVFVPCMLIPMLDFRADLVYNSNSLCEMPRDEIDKYFEFIRKIAPRYMFLASNIWPLPVAGGSIVPLDEFPISHDYTVQRWRYSGWAAGTGKLKEIIYARTVGN